MTPDALATFRRQHHACEAVVLVDVAARTVLFADCAIPLGQEHLDSLRDQACALLGDDVGLGTATACLSTPMGCRYFRSSALHPGEVFCALFGPQADLSDLDTEVDGLFAETTSVHQMIARAAP